MSLMSKKTLISEKRQYVVLNTKQAVSLASDFLLNSKVVMSDISFGLAEIDDRYNVWRIPVLKNKERIGEVVINAFTAQIDIEKSTKADLLNTSQTPNEIVTTKKTKLANKKIEKSPLGNTVIEGNSVHVLETLPEESINLIFTSPPYYNAKPEYSEYSTYEEYLDLMRKIIKASHRVLSEGRFFVINISPVLIRRASRSEASKRIAVPFDLHSIFTSEGFEFIDDIHWVKPEGAGWSLGRGRRFAADRNPLQYKPVPVTEYILVYRKKTNRLIDWNIRNHHNSQDVIESKISDGYETTNLWRINPSRSKDHPATFPIELAEKVIKYYSFQNDVILDPFGGSGTTGEAALNLHRKFVMIELENKYIKVMRKRFAKYDLLTEIKFESFSKK